MKTGEELKQAQSSSRQWSQMRSLIARTDEDTSNSKRNIRWFTSIWNSLSDDHLEELDTILKGWPKAGGQERSGLCTRMRNVTNAVRPKESIVNQIKEDDVADLVGEMKGTDVGEMMDLIKVLAIMTAKSVELLGKDIAQRIMTKWVYQQMVLLSLTGKVRGVRN